MKHLYPSRLLLAAALLAPCVLLADVIDPADYAASFNVKFTGYTGTTTLTDFPVLVRLSAARNGFNYSKCAVDGSDLRFSDADGNLIPHEIDTWDPSGESLVWVKVATLNRATVIRGYYGYQGAGDPPAVTAADVWNSDYVGVWHLGEAAAPLKESTGVSTPFDTIVGSPALAQSGAIGGAVNVSTGNFRAAHDADLDGFYDCTFEMWTKKTAHQTINNNVFYLNKRTSSNSNLSYFIYDQYDTSTPPHARVFCPSTNGTSSLSYSDRARYPELNAWAYNAWTRIPGVAFDSYLDGMISMHSTWPAAAPGMGTELLFVGDAPLILGSNQNNGGRFPGLIDELRISRIARSADWIKASHDCVAEENYAVYESQENDWAKYSHKFPVTFTNYVGETLSDFPVLVRISESSIEGFHYADCLQPNGGDLRFADSSGNLLASEVDTWNPSGTSLVWVKVPTLSAATKLTAYYGCIPGPPSNPTDVWDDDYKAVWHMNGDIAAIPDSTSGMADLQFWRSGGFNSSKVNVTFSDGIAGNAAEFGIYSDRIGCLATRASSAMVTNETACTVELWMVQDDHDPTDPTGRYLIKEVLSTGNTGIYTIYEYNTTDEANLKYKGEIYTYVKGTSATCWISGFTPIVTPARAQWHYQVLRYDSADGKFANILDCVKVKSGTYNVGAIYGDASSVDTLYVGASQSSDTSWPGKIDEIRISKVARSDAWLQATHDTITDAAFASCGAVLENLRGTLLILK